MRLLRTDLVPVLSIIAGGVVGALLTFSPLLLFGPSNNVPASVQPMRSPAKAAPAAPRPVSVWSPSGASVVSEDGNGNVYRVRSGGGEPEPVAVSPNGQWIVYQSDESGEARIVLRMGTGRVVFSRNGSLWTGGRGVDTNDIESIEVLKGESAVALYGEEASAGVIRIILEEARQRR